MRLLTLIFSVFGIGCEQESQYAFVEPQFIRDAATVDSNSQQSSRPKSQRTEYGLLQSEHGFKAVRWDESRSQYAGEPCIASWNVRSTKMRTKLQLTGRTMSTNTGIFVGNVNIYGGNLAESHKLTHLGQSNANGEFTIQVPTGKAGPDYKFLYTGGLAEPLIQYPISQVARGK